MASNTLSPDTRLPYLPAQAFDDSIELLDGVHATLNSLEQMLRDHFATLEPVTPSVVLGLIRVSRAGCRVVSNTLFEAEAEAEEGAE